MKTSAMYVTYFILLLAAKVHGQKEGDTCTDQYTSAAGICKPVEECETAKQDLQESGIQPTFCSPTNFGNAVVCCRDGLKIFDSPASARDGEFPSWGIAGYTKRVSERKCEQYSRGVVKRVDYLLLLLKPEIFSISVKCDVRTASLPAEVAEPGEFPHMVAIGWKEINGKYLFKCGGSLISKRFILTAAQCSKSHPRKEETHEPEPSIVRLGDQNLDDSVKDGVTPVDVPIRHFHSHPDYHPPKRYNDIGLVELARDVQFNSNIRPACLWISPDLSGYDKVISTGWSIINTNKTTLENELEKASINLIENNYCDSLLSNAKNRKWMGFNDSQMCAGELNRKWDSCLNEGGSPLQVASKENQCIFYVLGITSFGMRCSVYQVPSVYTRVSSYLDWIEGIVWPGE